MINKLTAILSKQQVHLEKMYFVLFGLIYMLLVVPWIYYQKKAVQYSFLPRRVLFVLIGVLGFAIILVRQKELKRTVLLGAFFGLLGVVHWQYRGFFEAHYFWQFIYLEVALLVFLAPETVKEKMLKCSTWVLYFFLLKALFYRMGTYIHGGLLSNNLYATYIVYLCFIEVARKRYWNLIPSFAVLYYAGSKAAYLACIVLVLFATYTYLNDRKPDLKLLKYIRERIGYRFNFYWALGISTVIIFILTMIMIQTISFKEWSKTMEVNKQEITRSNMINYGLGKETAAAEEERKVLLLTREMQFRDNKMSIEAKPLITDVKLSTGLRLTQYSFVYQNLHRYFFLGNTVEAQTEMYGHNPHSAVPDFISRLGLLYLLVMLVFYVKLYKSMNLLFFNLGLLPILCFQPYGFTIGHSMVILSLIYVLTKQATGQKELTKI